MEKQTELKVREFHTDNGSEFINSAITNFCNQKGIKHSTSCTYTPQNNAIIERMWRSLLNVTRCLITQSQIPKRFYNEALLTNCHLLSFRPNPINKAKSIYECWFGRLPKYDHLHNFGCDCYITVLQPHQQDKLSGRAHKGIFLGYDDQRLNGYRVFDIDDNKLIISRDVQFDDLKYSHVKTLTQNGLNDIELHFERINNNDNVLIDVSDYKKLCNNQPSVNVEIKSAEKNSVSNDYEHETTHIEPIVNDQNYQLDNDGIPSFDQTHQNSNSDQFEPTRRSIRTRIQPNRYGMIDYNREIYDDDHRRLFYHGICRTISNASGEPSSYNDVIQDEYKDEWLSQWMKS